MVHNQYILSPSKHIREQILTYSTAIAIVHFVSNKLMSCSSTISMIRPASALELDQYYVAVLYDKVLIWCISDSHSIYAKGESKWDLFAFAYVSRKSRPIVAAIVLRYNYCPESSWQIVGNHYTQHRCSWIASSSTCECQLPGCSQQQRYCTLNKSVGSILILDTAIYYLSETIATI